jgi:hypothetical protein
MDIENIKINNIQVKDDLSIIKSGFPIDKDDWNIIATPSFRLGVGATVGVLFITIAINRHFASLTGIMAIQSSFTIQVKDREKPTTSDIYRFAELIVISKAHARAIFLHRVSNTNLAYSRLPYISTEEELENIDPASFEAKPD